jgi:hypothetical protein
MNQLRHALTASVALTALALTIQPLFAQSCDAEPATRAANDAFTKSLPFATRRVAGFVRVGRLGHRANMAVRCRLVVPG